MFQKGYKTISKQFQNVAQLNILAMKKIIFLLMMCAITLSAAAQEYPAGNIVQAGGLYFTDASQTQLFTGNYQEYYSNGNLKLEIYIKNGLPHGTCVIYFDNNNPKEIRSYKDGMFHGVWRTYNEKGVLTSEAEYINNKKNGLWQIWDESGTLRYKLNYSIGKKIGVWKMWNKDAELIDEKAFA